MQTKNNGKFIVLYGINNLGKTTQAKMLVDRLNLYGHKAEYLKYPIYDLEPSGKILNNYLREGNVHNLTPREAQIFYAKNRTQYEKELIKKLEAGIHIIAEDYTGTGLAWGIGAGIEEQFLKYINSHLLKEDLAFLFDGERFREATEAGHKHETDDDLINKVRTSHVSLGREFGWENINANLSIKDIHNILWQKVIELINAEDNNTTSNALLIERLSPSAKIPTRGHANDAGLDLYSSQNYAIRPGEKEEIKTGIKMAIPVGCVGLIWDKSGLAQKEIHTIGGVIDADYRGEIIILIKNLSDNDFYIQEGQKIAQIIIQKVEFPEIEEKKITDKTDRQNGIFGSTGIF